MEADLGISGVAHDALIVHEGDMNDQSLHFSNLAFEDHGDAARVGLHDMMVSPPFQTSTWMVRSNCVLPLPDWYDKIPAADWGLFAIAASHGDMLVEKVARSAYRKHGRSILAQLIDARASERNSWHRKSFRIIADAFPHAERTARWRLVHARSRLNAAVDQRRLLTAVVGFVVLFGAHDRKRLIGMISRPRTLSRRIRSTLRRSINSKAA